MKINFSIKRVGLLLKTDFIEFRKALLYYSFIVIASVVVYARLYINEAETILDGASFSLLYSIGFFVTFAWLCQLINTKLNKREIQYLMLPATHFEKFLSCVLEILIIMFLYVGLYYIGILLWNSLFYPFIQHTVFEYDSSIYNREWNVEFVKGKFIIYNMLSSPSDYTYIGEVIIGLLNFILSLYVLGYVIFKKGAGLITTLLIVSVGFVLVYLSTDFPFSTIFTRGNVIYESPYKGLARIAYYIPQLLSVLAIAVWYIIYLKFKEKEVR